MSDLDSEPRPRRSPWAIAAVTALALHLAGAALAIGFSQVDDSDEGLGASDVEFAVEMASPTTSDSNSNLPPGPEDSRAMEASPAQPEQKAETKETDLPQDKPQEAEDPDRSVTDNNPTKPDDDKQKVVTVQTQPMEARPNQIDSARQSLDEDAHKADKLKAPNPGLGKDTLKLTAAWEGRISPYFQRHLRYPPNRTDKKVVTVRVKVVLNRRGNVVSAEVTGSSGDQVFDQAAIAMIHRSDPVPAPPVALTQDEFVFTLPVVFRPPNRGRG